LNGNDHQVQLVSYLRYVWLHWQLIGGKPFGNYFDNGFHREYEGKQHVGPAKKNLERRIVSK
jgi:hypothetical protein